MAILDRQQHFINGEWVDSLGSETARVMNPATGEVYAMISLGTAADVDRAVAAASQARASFAKTSPQERKKLILSIRREYEKRAEDIAQAIMNELGAPIDLALNAQAGVAYGHFGAFYDAIDDIKFEESLKNGDSVLRQPIGVAALITPWNWPIHQICLKVLAAFAAGCPVVLKPSESTPINAMIFAEVLEAAGVPAGVFNLVNGNGQGVGRALAGHKDVDIVSFTGSTPAGVSVSQQAAASVKKVALELGGKSPCLVFADADLDVALTNTTNKIFSNSGQNCNAPTRMLVERSIYETVKSKAAKIANERKVDLPSKSGDHTGPVANERQYSHVQTLIQTGIDQGATVLAGGLGRPDGMENGCFVKPTIFADATNDMDIAQKEIFGPVLVIIPFDTEEEAVRIANETEFGLAAYIHTKDESRLRRVMPQLEAGMVFKNGGDISLGSPFGGMKRSGLGREGGTFGIEEFLEVKLLA